MGKRSKESLILQRGRGKPKPDKNAVQPRVPPPAPERHPPKNPTANRRGR